MRPGLVIFGCIWLLYVGAHLILAREDTERLKNNRLAPLGLGPSLSAPVVLTNLRANPLYRAVESQLKSLIRGSMMRGILQLRPWIVYTAAALMSAAIGITDHAVVF